MSYPYPPQPPQQGGWPQQPPQGYQPPSQQPGGWGPPAPGGWQQPPAQPQGWGPPAPQDQQWAAQQQDQTPAPAQGTLAAFYQQKSVGGGAALKFKNVGDWWIGIINRPIVDSDTEQQMGMKGTPNAGKPLVNNDGSPKWVLKLPLNVPTSEEHTDGLARWFCQGVARDQLNAAIARSRAPITTVETDRGPVQFYSPEPGAAILIKLAGKRQIPGLNDANVWEVQYFRPDHARQIAQQYGIEYPVIAESAPAPSSLPTPQPHSVTQGQQQFQQPVAQAPTGPPPSTADFAPPNPGQPGNPAQWNQAPGQQSPTAAQPPQQFPLYEGAASQQAPQQGPGAPPPVDWGNGGGSTGGNLSQQNGGHIPQAQPPAGPPPGLTPENQALMAQMTGRGGQQ